MIHIGIDISKKDFDCYSSGKINKFNQKKKGYRSFRSWMKKNFGEDPLICVMEATGVYHLALASYLVEQGIKVAVVNPLRPHYHAKACMVRVTNDASSARNIWDFAQKNQIKGGWSPMPAEIVKLRFWLKRIDLIQKERTKCTNRLKAMALQKALGKDEFTVTKQDLARWNQELEKARQKATELCEPFQEDEALFRSIPGVGKMGTMILISFFRANYQIDDARVALILAGMSLKRVSSGTSINKRPSLSKMGYARVRTVLYMCALSAVKYNPACKELYERILKRSPEKKKLALMAVACKLLRQAFGIFKSRIPFKVELSKQNLAKKVA